MMLTDSADGVVIAVNAEFIRATGYAREEAVGRSPRELRLLAGDDQQSAEILRQLRDTGDSTVSSVLRGQSRLSRVLWGWQNDLKYKDRAGKPRILPLRGVRSFAELVKDYATELRIKPVLTEAWQQMSTQTRRGSPQP